MNAEHRNRRDFLQTSAAGIAAMQLVETATAAQQKDTGALPLRPFGRTGEMVSIMSLGGHASTNPKKLSEKESVRLIQRALGEGLMTQHVATWNVARIEAARSYRIACEGGVTTSKWTTGKRSRDD